MEIKDKLSDNLELFYDVFSESCNYIYEITKANYFELFKLTAKNIIAGEVLNDFEEEDVKNLEKIYEPLVDKEFTTEEILKALQSQILRCLKETRNSNGLTTPDTLGMLVAYLIDKLFVSKKEISILDPLVGTGNLIYTIWNHLNKETILFGCDNNNELIEINQVIADMLCCDISLYLQDTLSLKLANLDLITFDFPQTFDLQPYFPYEAILKYLSMLNEDGYLIGILPDDFFNHDINHDFKKKLDGLGQVIGVIELPHDFFVSNRKTIIVFKRKPLKEKKCFMVKFSSFTDVKAFNLELFKLDDWFEQNKNILNEEV